LNTKIQNRGRVESLNYPRLMIAGAHSSAGKTTISLGIMKALSRQGWKVQPFKVGPDYIDPGLHRHAAGRPSHNLDSWMSSRPVVETIFARNAASADISLIEGVMGFYDGARGQRIKASSADIALILEVPVILVIDVGAMAQSCIAVAKGFIDYCPQARIQGIVLNRGGAYHQRWIVPDLERELGVKVIGCPPGDARISMPERHLGLLPADENPELVQKLDYMADHIEKHLDLGALRQIAHQAPPLNIACPAESARYQVKLGVARDRAFSFYYQDSLDFLTEMGAELVFFSPLDDTALPAVDGLYIGGGFPEMFLDALAGNHSMISQLRQAHQAGMPIVAECGGLMYLSEQISDWEGHHWNTAGIVPARIQMTRQLQALGYVEASIQKDSIVGRAGQVLRGHEFHFSTVENIESVDAAFSITGGMRAEARYDGYSRGNLVASYVHLHLRSNPVMVDSFLQACAAYRASRSGC